MRISDGWQSNADTMRLEFGHCTVGQEHFHRKWEISDDKRNDGISNWDPDHV